MGGIRYLKNMQAPYAHLGLKFIPLGGLNRKNAGEYLKEDCHRSWWFMDGEC